MSVASFPPASLTAQLAELRRERKMRGQVYPHLIASRKLTERQAAYQNAGLDGAIATLERLVDAQARGEPRRGELVQALRRVVERWPNVGPVDEARALLERIPLEAKP